jgi:hypothetical protein
MLQGLGAVGKKYMSEDSRVKRMKNAYAQKVCL